jgi:hypothetical protein
MSQVLILTDALSFACWEKREKKKKERSSPGWGGFPGLEAGHALLAVPGRQDFFLIPFWIL